MIRTLLGVGNSDDTDDTSSQSDRIFVATVLADAVLIIGYVLSALRPEHRVWSIGNRSRWSWQRWFNWTALSVVYAGFPLVGYFDQNTFVFTESRSTIIGGILSALGLSVSVQALLGLGLKESRSRVDWRNGMLTMDASWRETTATSRIQVIQELSRSSSRGSAVLHKSVRGTRSRQ